MFTKAGQLTARDNRRDCGRTPTRWCGSSSSSACHAAVALGFLAGPALEAWVGPLYREAAPVIGLLCLAAVVQAWAQALKMAMNGTGRPTLAAVLYGIEAVLHVALGIALPRATAPSAWPRPALIGVVVMEGMLMLPLAYRRLGDSILRRALRTVRTLALPTVASGGLAWVVGRGGGPLYVFTDTHGRIVGLAAVAAAGTVVVAVFYALLLVSLPADQRHRLFARSRTWVGRASGPSALVSSAVSGAVVRAGAGRTRMGVARRHLWGPWLDDRGRPPERRGIHPPLARVAGRALFTWLDLPDNGLAAGAAILCPTMGLESAYSARALRDLAHRLASSGWAALRVDYTATGDSAGAWTDPTW